MHVYVYSLVIRSIRPPRRGGERDRVESVCNILRVIIAPARQSRPRARDSPTRRRTSRDGTPEHHKKSAPSAERLRRVVVARPLAPLGSFVR